MSLMQMSALILIYGAVLAGLVLNSYRQRLALVEGEEALTQSGVEAVFKSSELERYLGYGLIALIGWLIYQTIQTGYDFSALMLGATVFTGVVWAIDRATTQKRRQALIERAKEKVESFEEKTDISTLEPGMIENCRAFFPILLFVFLLRSFLVEPFQIPSGSMKPTLEISDFILVNRFTYGIRMPITNEVLIPVNEPERGDVIVFKPPHEPNKNFIKRVIAVPGDRIEYDYARKSIRINGELVRRQRIDSVSDDEGRYNLFTEYLPGREHLIYLDQDPSGTRFHEWMPANGIVVPEGKYFVMGDNRDNSHDARYWEGLRRQIQGDLSNQGNNAWGFVDENAILGEAFLIWMHWEGFYPSFSRAGKIQ